MTGFTVKTEHPASNFNSHAHVERDKRVTLGFMMMQISTHTLTWSVTSFDCNRIFRGGISTHTLTWSVTGAKLDDNAVIGISTHTLTWSVTLDVVYIWCLLNVMRTYCFI